MGSLNGQSAFFHGCDILQMLHDHGEIGTKSQIPLICRKDAILGKSSQILNLINNAIVVSSAYMALDQDLATS